MRADSAQLVNEVRKANGRIDKFAKGAKKAFGIVAGAAAGLAGAKGISDLVGGFADAADEAIKLGRTLGLTAEQISALGFAAERSGVTQEQLGVGLKTLARNAQAAGLGLGEAKDSFLDLGISVKDAEGNLKSVDMLLNEVADGLKGVTNTTERAAIAQRIFGESGTRLINLLGDGSEGLKELTDQAAEFGAVISTDAALSAEQFNDALTNLNAQATGLKNAFGTGFVQSFAPFLETLNKSKGSLDAFKTAGAAVAGTLKALAVSGALVKNAFEVVGRAIRGVAVALAFVLKGEFKKARLEVKDAFGDIQTDVTDVTNAFEAAFSTGIEPLTVTVKKTDELKNSLGGVNTALTEIEQRRALRQAAADAEKAAAEAERLQEQLKQRAEALKESVRTPAEILEEQLAEIDRLAAELPGILDPETYNRLAERFKNEFAESVKNSLDEVNENAEAVKDNLKSAFGEEISRIAQGNFDEIGKSFTDLIQKMLVEAAASELTNIFGGLAGGAGGGGIGGFVAGLLGGGFGGFRANGGMVQAGTPFMVGERGPELFVPSQAGEIVPAGGAPVNVVNNFNITAPGGRLSPESQQQVAAKAGSAVQRAVNRNR